MLERGTLLDVLQDLLIARFVADNEQPASGIFHRLQCLVARRHARGAGPRQSQRLQLGAQFHGACRLNVERVVVKKEFFHVRPVFLGLRHFAGHVVGRALAPRMSTQRLRPQAERTLRRAATRRIERHIRVEQEGNCVAAYVQVAPVNVGDVGQRIQVLNLRTVGIVHDLTVLEVRDSENVFQRLALRIFDHGVVEFLAADKIHGRGRAQRLLRQHADMRPDERNLDVRVGVLDRLRQQDVPRESGRAGEQDQELVVLADADGLFRGNVVRRSIQQP